MTRPPVNKEGFGDDVCVYTNPDMAIVWRGEKTDRYDGRTAEFYATSDTEFLSYLLVQHRRSQAKLRRQIADHERIIGLIETELNGRIDDLCLRRTREPLDHRGSTFDLRRQLAL